MSAILDTNLLIGQWRPRVPGRSAISVASIAELQFGVLRASSIETRSLRLANLAGVESEYVPIPVSAEIARAYGQCAAALTAIGRNPRSRVWDLIIAATALTHSSTLHTRNADDFLGLEHLIEIVVPEHES
jgi:predicted nucleic acid-binding protein